MPKKETKQEGYSGTAIGTGGAVGAKSIGFDFRVNRDTSDEEVDQLATLLKEKGPDALRRTMEKLDVGRISPTGSVGNQIAVARKRGEGCRHDNNYCDCSRYAVCRAI